MALWVHSIGFSSSFSYFSASPTQVAPTSLVSSVFTYIKLQLFVQSTLFHIFVSLTSSPRFNVN